MFVPTKSSESNRHLFSSQSLRSHSSFDLGLPGVSSLPRDFDEPFLNPSSFFSANSLASYSKKMKGFLRESKLSKIKMYVRKKRTEINVTCVTPKLSL